MEKTNISSLPDSVWLKILQYLTADQLITWTNLSEVERQTSPFFQQLFHVCGDKELWRHVIWRGGVVKPIVLRKLIKFLGSHTKRIFFEGSRSSTSKKVSKSHLLIPESLLHSIQIRCPKLEDIRFSRCCFDYHSHPLKKLPISTKHIELMNIHWLNLPNEAIRGLQSSPLFKLKKRLPKLEGVTFGVSKPNKSWVNRYDVICLFEINGHPLT